MDVVLEVVEEDVEVEVNTEKLKKGKVLNVGSAYLTMVALDEHGRPSRIPRLIFETANEKLKSKQAFLRRKNRLSR